MKCISVCLVLAGVLAGVLGIGSNEGECECVPYYMCMYGKIITNGEGLLGTRGPQPSLPHGTTTTAHGRCNESQCQCEHYLHTCCMKANTPEQSEPPLPPSEPLLPPINRTVPGCGQRNQEGVGFRIVGNVEGEAQFGEFPWMVALLREEEVAVDGSKQRLKIYQCGGSLIHPQVVLTTAHCVNEKLAQELKVRAGEWDVQTTNELLAYQEKLVTKVLVHEGYYVGALYNDIALLILQEPVTVAENVDVICLPRQGEIFDHSRCLASGWGRDTFGNKGSYQTILKKVELPVVPRPACVTALRKTRLGPNFQLHQSFICAGGEPNKDTCQGDGGSPLVCALKNHPLHYQQTGIVSWGIGCGKDKTPGVYANVAMFRDWIDQKMAAHNFDTSSYTY